MPTVNTSTKARKPRAKAARKAPAKPTSVKTPRRASDYAERAVLIPVGAALVARDRVVSGVSETISTYSTTTKAQAQLKRFERRGVTARNRLEREVRKARVRVERELRQRRRTIESTVSELEGRSEAIAKSGSEIAGRVPELANKVQERILSLV